MVLLHHHLEAVAQIDSEAQKMVVAGMEEDEKSFPHMGSCDNPLRKIPYYRLRPVHFGH
jgi:hypothetical protein